MKLLQIKCLQNESLFEKRRKHSMSIFAAVLAALFAICFTVPSFAGPLTGSYKITANTPHEISVQLSVQLALVNPGDSAVSVSSVGVHSLSAPGHIASSRTSVTVEAHSTASVTVSFVIPKSDFAAWSHAPQQVFFLKIQHPGGRADMQSVVLLQTKAE